MSVAPTPTGTDAWMADIEARLTKLESPPPPPPTTSPDDTMATLVVAPATGTRTDANGHVWKFGAASGSNWLLLKDGVSVYGGAAGTEFGILTGVIYTLASNGNWYKDTGSSFLNIGPSSPFSMPAAVQPAFPGVMIQPSRALLLDASFGSNPGRMGLSGIQANFLPNYANGNTSLGGNAECEIYQTNWTNHIIDPNALRLKAFNTRGIVGTTSYNGADVGAVSSAMISTKTPYFRGYFELRCQQPPGRGSWPAFWTDISNIPPGGLPAGVTATWPPEVDFFEIFNSFGSGQPGDYSSWNEHIGVITGNGYPGTVTVLTDNTHNGGFYALPNTDLSAGMHVYGAEWLADPRGDRWRFYLDGNLVKDVIYPWVWTNNTEATFGGYIIVNLAYNPSWMLGIDPAQFPAYMILDYLRIWQ